MTDEGKIIINFGIIWFISVFIISLIVELLFFYQNKTLNGKILNEKIFLNTALLNMIGTSLLFYTGAKKLKSCDYEIQINEGRKIMLFGIFWLVFWTIIPIILSPFGMIGNVTNEFLLFIAIPGMVINVIIGKWSAKINARQGLEDLINAQKKFNLDKIRFEEQLEKFYLEREEFEEKQKEFNNQKKELQKQKKELTELRDELKVKSKDIVKQQKEIQKARGELEATWKELEDTIKKNPFKLSIKNKLNKDLFIKEIEELKRTKPGDVSSIRTNADQIIAGIKEELNKEITDIEDEYYFTAFSEYFRKVDGDLSEYDRIRIKYNPTIHIQGDRRNKEWAEKRRFELSKIEKSIKEDKSIKEKK